MKMYKKNITILYVEDEDDVRQGYARTLTRVSKELFTASNGAEGLELYKEFRPDIVISDIKMPVMDGIDMAKAIVAINDEAHIIFTSAHSESAYLLEAIALQVQGYLLKPVQKKSLIKMIEKTALFIEAKEIIEQRAYMDGLTGVANRYKFEEVFTFELNRSIRHGNALSLAIVDIDNFKIFNDNFGHLIGDEVLIMLAQNMKENIRASDFFARWGGEEFVILFSNTKVEDAMLSAENFRCMVENIEHQSLGRITASFGLTQYKKNDTLKAMFDRADRALYLAKENGKNCVKSIV